jgi:hypothetical protein
VTATVLLGWALIADGLLLVAILVLLVAVRVWFVLRGQRRTIEAQQFAPGGLTEIISAHLPLALRTNVASEEIPLLRQVIERKVQHCRHAVLASAAVAILLAPIAGIITWSQVGRAEAERISARLPPELDVRKIARGTWGWKYNSLYSCANNPHTIVFSDGDRKMSIRFKDPIWTGSTETRGPDYDVIGSRRNELVLSIVDDVVKENQSKKPVEWSLVFRDQNVYYFRRSDTPTKTTGDIVRCSK